MADYNVSFVYQTATPDITGDTTTEPTLGTLIAKITGGTVATGDVLRFFVTTDITGFTDLSWQYTVQDGDDFETNGKSFTLSGAIILAIAATTPNFTDPKVYKGSDWGFTAA